ncbi:proteasome inhibitor PI31 subunit [Pseudomyrmex gracilis]|uniref:proteasome inhibitor PI31 subunit n=1 Tax=Pseudomyrmex gracilis TaxID=219809 RepID=UPI000994FDDF|nr:proteasome inhibitor PI31 subunit [Pseudomyrmex gracilis]
MAGLISTFGIELLQTLYHDELLKKEDVLILLVHWYLIKLDFKCIGLGDQRTFTGLEKGSELLPKEWNLKPSYSLRYVKNGKLYVLLGIKSDDDLLINLLKIQDDAVSSIQFPIEQTVSTLHGSLDTVVPTYQTVLNNLRRAFDVIDNPTDTKEVTTQTSTTERNRIVDNPLRVLPRPQLHDRPLPEHDPLRVGLRDLDPLRPGGGMIFDPFPRPAAPPAHLPGGLGVPGRLPPGAVPPGARFDPFGPPDIDNMAPRRRRPDDDHLPPPGYDDMFL